MEHGPLPPHERQWRHPSELAAEERAQARAESLPFASRAFAFATGSIGLAALAVVFLVVTPGRQAAPVAVSATTTPSVDVASDDDGTATIVAARRSSPEVAAVDPAVSAARATPIGSGEFAVVLRSSLGLGNQVPDLMLPSGRVTSGDLMEHGNATGDAVLVQLDEREPGHRVADRRPHERDTVTVMTDPPITVTLADLEQVDATDGTPVVDTAGHLVGLCSERSGGGTRLVEVSSDLTDATGP